VSVRSRRIAGGGMTALTGLAAALVVAMLAVVVVDVARGGASRLSWERLASAPRDGITRGGVFPAIWGTAVLTLLMTVAVLPVGVATAVYLHEYAPPGSHLALTFALNGVALAIRSGTRARAAAAR
jgi:phosphate transport system permease protein